VAGTAASLIVVTYAVEGAGWRLSVSDSGVGMPNGDPEKATSGLGTSIVEALAKQLGGRVEASTGPDGVGTTVSVTHRPFSCG
jgi:two-component sensor histidine kinase